MGGGTNYDETTMPDIFWIEKKYRHREDVGLYLEKLFLQMIGFLVSARGQKDGYVDKATVEQFGESFRPETAGETFKQTWKYLFKSIFINFLLSVVP